jgi:hypothetical protein
LYTIVTLLAVQLSSFSCPAGSEARGDGKEEAQQREEEGDEWSCQYSPAGPGVRRGVTVKRTDKGEERVVGREERGESERGERGE